jgi:hypothetical protein
MQIMRMINRDICCGVLFVLVGAAFGYQALFQLPLGTLRNMGPGFFPMFLSAAAVVIGIAVTISGLRQEHDDVLRDLPWRAIATVLAGPLLFGVMVAPFGLVPSLLVLSTVVAFASQKTSFRSAAAIAVCMTVICVAIFTYGLGIPIPLFGSLLVNP